MSQNSFRSFRKGILLSNTATDFTDNLPGSLWYNSTVGEFHGYIDGAIRELTTNDGVQTLTNKTLSGVIISSVTSGSGTFVFNTSGTVTVPNTTDTLATLTGPQTLTNTTLSGNTAVTLISGSGTLVLNTSGTITIPNGTDTLVTLTGAQVLTNKTLSGNTASNLINGSGTFNLNSTGVITVPNITDTLVTLTATQTLTNKSIDGGSNTITNIPFTALPAGSQYQSIVMGASVPGWSAVPLNQAAAISGALPIVNGGTGQTTNTTAFNALAPTSPIAGQVISYNGTNWIASTIQAGEKNYITYNNFENNATTGWSLGTVGTLVNGIPTGTPTFGSGASGNLSISTVGSGQLAGSYSLSYASSAATTVGNMLATQAYAIDPEDQAKVLTFKFYYSAVSGTSNCNFSGTSSNSFGIAIYDVTNSVWLTSTGNFAMVQGIAIGYCTGTCQTNATTSSLRFVIYNANATSGAATLYLDDFILGPQTAPFGPAMTDWVPYTPTFQGFGTPTGVSFFSRRVGDSLEVMGGFSPSGSTGVQAQISLGFNGANSNVVADSTKVSSSGQVIGSFALGSSGSFSGYMMAFTSSSPIVGMGMASSGTVGYAYLNGSTISTTAAVSVYFKVPIVGWSSNTSMSSDTDTRVIVAQLKLTSNSAPSANSPIPFQTVLADTAGAYNPSSGLYMCPVSGFYRMSSVLLAGGTPVAVYAGLNGANAAYIQGTSTTSLVSGTATIKCNAGDTLGFYADAGGCTFQGGDSWAYIERISGPAVIAATESVNAAYTDAGAGQAVNGTPTAFVYGTKIKDSHNAYNATTGVYTIPVSGFYQISANFLLAGTTLPTSGNTQIYVYVNGSQVGANITYGNGTGDDYGVAISMGYQFLAGDTMKIVATSSVSTTAIGSANYNNFSIYRVGN